jgi:hypothetical protein
MVAWWGLEPGLQVRMMEKDHRDSVCIVIDSSGQEAVMRCA